jgi:hypothetical protein
MTISRLTYGDESNLKLDAAPLLYIYAFSKMYAWVVLLPYLHVSHLGTYLY